METAIVEQSNLQPVSKEELEPRQLLVAILGFEAADEESFTRFFQVARPYQRKYVAANPTDKAGSDIMIVNYDNSTALKERDTMLDEYPQIQVVAVSRGPLNEPPDHHVRGMLFAARVLSVLDKVSVVPRSKTSPDQLRAAEDSNLQRVAERPVAPQVQPTPMGTEKPALTVIVTPGPDQTSCKIGGYRALVVDDSTAIQKSLELNLAKVPQIGLIDFADSGESAIVQAESNQYDLIFLDVMMPGIDGYETCTRLRKKPEYKKTPIIMVSGKTSPLDEVKGVMAGCTTYLTKPVQPEAFQKLSIRVLAWLDKQKRP